MPITQLTLIRHGESLGNVAAAEAQAAGAEVITLDRRDPDVELSPLGQEQSRSLGRGLGPVLTDGAPSVVWCSPWVRARQTAEIALAAAELQRPLIIDERLRDRELGVLDLLTSVGVARRFPFEAERRRWLGKFYHRPPGGESWADVALRLRSFVRDLDAVPGPGRGVIVCHDAVVLLLRYVCEGLTERQVLDIQVDDPVRNVSMTELGREPGGPWRLVRYNSIDHLVREGTAVTEHRGEVDVQHGQ